MLYCTLNNKNCSASFSSQGLMDEDLRPSHSIPDPLRESSIVSFVGCFCFYPPFFTPIRVVCTGERCQVLFFCLKTKQKEEKLTRKNGNLVSIGLGERRFGRPVVWRFIWACFVTRDTSGAPPFVVVFVMHRNLDFGYMYSHCQCVCGFRFFFFFFLGAWQSGKKEERKGFVVVILPVF